MVDELDVHFQSLYRDLINAIAQGNAPDVAHGQVKQLQERMFGAYPDLLASRLSTLALAYDRYLEELNRVRYLQKKALNFGRDQWYLGPATDGSLWERLNESLRSQGRSDEEIQLVDTDSTTVVGLLDNPAKDTFSTRGLVVGHVQSGKTGNMAAVITKAADTQYKFFLVLSGITDQLRNQTQLRLKRDVVDLAPERWMQWTSENTPQSNGDFNHSAVGGFSFDHRNQIAVVKKNAAVLRRFLAKLRNTDTATLRQTPILIIDDECDQASVNSARLATAITKINDLIRQILGTLPRAAYVGYTATPFANVLIDPSVPEDLYPRHFIHALKRPPAYFGAMELFGRHALEGEYDEGAEGLDMIRTIPEDEIGCLRPTPRGAAIVVPESLKVAIRYFVMVVAARRVRGQENSHNTMLIHTSVLNSVHRETEAVVRPYLAHLAERLAAGDREVFHMCEAEWIAEQDRVLSEQFDRSPVGFSDLAKELAPAAESIRVRVENWTSTERLDYTGGPHSYMVIGGNVLARGLTLEGLSVSYFLRSSSQYDTLMQMGRWFGYRAGFEDLPRVWVEEKVREAFYDLATVEAEIRRDIRRFAEEEITPLEFAVRIRKIPGMTITAPAKMRSAVPVAIGYAGTHVQTFRFERKNKALLQANWKAGADLVNQISVEPQMQGSPAVFRGVPASRVTEFLRNYTPHPTHKALASAFVREYVEKNAESNTRLATWTVAIIGGDGGPSEQALGRLGKVPTVIRSAEANPSSDASIKALMTRRDILVDLERGASVSTDASWDELKAIREGQNANALLLLYPIQAKSAPKKGGTVKGNARVSLDADADVLGYGIVFPGGKQLSGTYVAANISPDTSEPADELGVDDEIPSELLEAGPAGEAQ